MTDVSVFSLQATEDFSVAYIQDVAFGGSDPDYEVFMEPVASDDEIIADDAESIDVDTHDVEELDAPHDIADLDADDELVQSGEGDEAMEPAREG